MITPSQPLFANYESDEISRAERQIEALDARLAGANLQPAERDTFRKQRDQLANELPNLKPMVVKSLPILGIAQVNNQFIMLVLHDNKVMSAHAVGVPDNGVVLRSIDPINMYEATRPKVRAPYARETEPVVDRATVEAMPETPKKKLLLKKETPKAEG